jgi:hypothetical protein
MALVLICLSCCSAMPRNMSSVMMALLLRPEKTALNAFLT